ncbi:hypothetical protein H311_01691 [Anncaliia algerae PRA109]|nr:hypothetical protein H311_01691 [Anncaliia algerae PRA109]
MSIKRKTTIIFILLVLRFLNVFQLKNYFFFDEEFICNAFQIKKQTKENISLYELMIYYMPIRRFLYIICDFIVCYYLKNLNYLLFSLIIPSSISSLESFLMVLNNKVLMYTFAYFNPFFIIFDNYVNIESLLINYPYFYTTNQFVNINTNWFSNINAFEQYSEFLYKVFWLNYIYLSKKTTLKPLLMFIFKPSDLRNLLFLYFYYNLKLGYFYFVTGVLYLFLVNSVFKNGIVNLNFVNWCCMLLNISLCIEIFMKIRKK